MLCTEGIPTARVDFIANIITFRDFGLGRTEAVKLTGSSCLSSVTLVESDS